MKEGANGLAQPAAGAFFRVDVEDAFHQKGIVENQGGDVKKRRNERTEKAKTGSEGQGARNEVDEKSRRM